MAVSPVLVSLLLISITGSALILLKFRWTADHLRVAISAEMSQRLRREVEVGHVSGNLLSKVVLGDVRVARERRLADGLLLQVGKVTVRYDLPALLKREVTPVASVRTVTIEAPDVFVERSREGKLNLLELVKPRKPTPPENRFRGEIVLKDGRLQYHDSALLSPSGRPLHLSLNNLAANADFANPDHLRASFHASVLPTDAPNASALSGQVSFDSVARDTALSVSVSDLDLAAVVPHVQQAKQLGQVSGLATVRANLLIRSSPESRVQSRESKLQGPKPKAQGPKSTIDYRVAFSTPHCVVSSPKLPYPVHFSGSALLSPDMAFLEGMKVGGAGFVGTLTGEVHNFSEPQLRLNIAAEYLDLNRFRGYLPASMKVLDLQFRSPGSGSFAVWGDLRHPCATGELNVPMASLASQGLGGKKYAVAASDIALETLLGWPVGAPPVVSASAAFHGPRVSGLVLPGGQAWIPNEYGASGPVSVDFRWVQGKPTAEGRFDLSSDEWVIMGSRLPVEAAGRFAFGPRAFSITEAAISTPLGGFKGKASLLPGKTGSDWSVEGKTEAVRLDRLVAYLPSLKQALGQGDLGGVWWGDVAFSSKSGAKEGMVRGELSDFHYAPDAGTLPGALKKQPAREISLREASCLLRLDEDSLDIGSLSVSDPALHLLIQGTMPLGMKDLAVLRQRGTPSGLEGDCDLRLALDEADLAKLRLEPGLEGKVSGRARMHGPASLPNAEVEMAAHLAFSAPLPQENAEVGSSGRPSPAAAQPEKRRLAALVKAEGTTARMVLKEFTLLGPQLTGQVKGEVTGLYVAGRSRPRCDLRLTGDTCGLSRLVGRGADDSAAQKEAGKVSPLSLTGYIHVNLGVEGPLLGPSVQGSVSLKSGFLLGEEIEQTEAQLVYQRGSLEARKVSVQSPLFNLEGSCALCPVTPAGKLEGAFRLDEIPCGGLANSFGLSGRAFAGGLRGDGKVEGTVSHPQVRLDIGGEGIRVGRTDFTSLSAQLKYADGVVSFDKPVEVTLKGEDDAAQGTVQLTGEANLSNGHVNALLDGKALDLNDLSRSLVAVRPRGAPPAPRLLTSLRGLADEVKITLTGSFLTKQRNIKPPDVKIVLHAQPVSVAEEEIGELRVNASFAKNQLQIAELRAINGDQHLVASGYVNLPLAGGQRTIGLGVKGSSLALDGLAQFLPGKIPGQLKGKAVFGAWVDGSLTSPNINAYLEVEKPSWHPLREGYQAPAEGEAPPKAEEPSPPGLVYDHLRLDVALNAGDQGNVQVNPAPKASKWHDWLDQHPTGLNVSAEFSAEDGRGGSVLGNLPFSWQPLGLPRDQEMSLIVSIEKDNLASLTGIVPRLTHAYAPVQMSVRVGGTLDRARVDGSVAVRGGQLGVSGLPSDVQAFLCELGFESRNEPPSGPVNKLAIGKFQGRVLGGSFEMSGGADRVVSFSPSKALNNDYDLTLSIGGLDLTKLNAMLQSPSMENPGAVSFELPPLRANAKIRLARNEKGLLQLQVEKLDAVGPKDSLLSCQGKVTFTQSDLRKMKRNLFDLTLKMRNFEMRVIPYFHGEINTKGPDHVFLRNSSGEPVKVKGDIEITKGVMTMAARHEPPLTPEPRLRPQEEPFWDVRITPGRDFFIILPRFRQPMDGEINIAGGIFSPLIQGRLWARPGGRLVSLSEQWRTEKCDVDFWASVSHGEGGWAAQYNGTIDFNALGELTYRGRKYEVTMTLKGPLLRVETGSKPAAPGHPETVFGAIPDFKATPYLTPEEVFAALGRTEMVERIMAGANAREVLSQEIFNIGEAEAARRILDPIGGELKQALGLEALSLEYGIHSPISIRLTKDIARGITLSYATTFAAAREEYEVRGDYRLPERFSRGIRPKSVGITYDNTKTVAGNLSWQWNF